MIVGKPIITVEQINQRVSELARTISADLAGKDVVAISILKGSFMFFADLIRLLDIPVTVDFLISSSYYKDHSTGKVSILSDIKESITGRHVLLVDDIVDTGISISYIKEMLINREPSELKLCVLLDKKSRRKVDVSIDYVGFDIPDYFVVGYGLDYQNRFRNLPYIVEFRKELR